MCHTTCHVTCCVICHKVCNVTCNVTCHIPCKHEVHEKVGSGSSMIGFPLVIAVSERDIPGIEPGPLG